MPEHRVSEDQHISHIAARYGFASIDPIWDHPRNEDLRRLRRENPDVLQEGDVVFVPEKEPGTASASTGKTHRYVVKRPKLLLILDTKDLTGEPLQNTPCELVFGDNTYELTANGDGIVRHEVSPFETIGQLKIDGLELPLHVGRLDPVDSETGQRERLRNLGFLDGSTAAQGDDDVLSNAILMFQTEHDLEVDGICGPETQQKLLEEHGEA